MKRILLLLLALAVACGAFFYKDQLLKLGNQIIYYSACDNPQVYKIGTIDLRFGIDRSTFAQDIAEATGIWSSAEGKPLFANSDKATLTVNLIYDKRQLLNSQINNLEDQIHSQDNSIKPQISQYKRELGLFQQRVAALNSKIDTWNKEGGAPPDEYAKLTKEQADLKAESTRLNQEADELSQSTDSYNSQVNQLNHTINKFQTALDAKPEEGIYSPTDNTINVFFNNGHSELVHTLAHEFGHALGMGHNVNQKSIMYPKTTTNLTPSAADLDSLAYVCRKQSLWERIQARVGAIMATLKTQ